jgi:hypothetical protein
VNLGLNERNKEEKAYPTGWPRSQPLSESPLVPDPQQPRSFGYDQALVGKGREETKQLLLETGTYGYITFFINDNEPLDFESFLDKDSLTNDAGNWLTPSSLHFQDSNKQALSQKQLTNKLSRHGDQYEISPQFIKEFFTGSMPGAQDGGGHAVAVLGWDDHYRNPKVDLTDNVINAFQWRIDRVREEDPERANSLEQSLKGFSEFLSNNGITYTNAKSRSRGAWIIQNSWGSEEAGKQYQYLPYEFASVLSANDLKELSNIPGYASFIPDYSTIFHQADASGLFGHVQSSSTAIPKSNIWNMSGNSWHGLGYRFQAQQDAIVAISSYLQPSVTEIITDADGATLYRYNFEESGDQWLQATLWRASDLLNPNPQMAPQPFARSRVEQAFTGYQTVEFDQPVNLDAIGDEPLIATLQLYADAAATQPISNARLLSYTAKPEAIAQRQEQLNRPDFTKEPLKNPVNLPQVQA